MTFIIPPHVPNLDSESLITIEDFARYVVLMSGVEYTLERVDGAYLMIQALSNPTCPRSREFLDLIQSTREENTDGNPGE